LIFFEAWVLERAGLVFRCSLLRFVSPGHRRGFGDALVGYSLRVCALACGGSCKRPIEPIQVYRSLAALPLEGGVHGGEKLGPEFIQYFVDKDVGQSLLRKRTVKRYMAVTQFSSGFEYLIIEVLIYR
jgi:hypothetical protein